ncbi:MAG: LD-carboxypeptidase, partial [Deltaproteobacteria bacterium]|nr:LD-carboxypeptidase [Deltaproteobacteria bacterium]
ARRAAELSSLFADPQVRAIFFARGGYGTARVIPLLDVNPAKADPKIVVGYSDLTVLHAYLHHHCKWTSFYGPTLVKHLGDHAPATNWEWCLKAIASLRPLGALPATTCTVIKPGKASGVLLGGCLMLVHCGLKTIYEWDTSGGILFLEDAGEKLYAIDRMLTHLKHAGAFRGVKGLLFGSLVLHPDEPAKDQLIPMLTDFFHDFPGPVLAGFPAGHGDPFITLPFGARATLTTDPPGITIDEAAVT